MFGYILPEKPELKIKEYEIFKGYYCGICKSIGDRYGQIPRLTLNYDCTFLALLLASIKNEDAVFKRERCVVHPLKKQHVARKSEIIDYASDINLILAYYNLMDDWIDQRSIVSGAGTLFLSTVKRKLQDKYPKKCVIIEEQLKCLQNLEREKCSFIDMAAEPFAKLMEEVTAYEPYCEDKDLEKILRWMGYNLGKWIYILDAYDDIEEDIKRGIYNPIIYQFEYKGQEITEFKGQIKERIRFILLHTLSEVSKAYELLNINNNAGILENIIYFGMLRKTEHILENGSCGNFEKSI
jgi:hypothetical protein